MQSLKRYVSSVFQYFEVQRWKDTENVDKRTQELIKSLKLERWIILIINDFWREYFISNYNF